jgi:cytosine/adenosine deaminase-related metal-dependent hydrolase
MPRIHRAEWVLPIDAPPIRDGWVEVDGGRIVGVGASDAERRMSDHDPEPRTPNPESRTVILPALVNAHTHLELSWMRGRVPPGEAMPAWATRLIGERLTEDRSAHGIEKRQKAVVSAIGEARASGTTLVGEVSNTLESCEPLIGSDVSAVVFHELLGFRAADPVGMVEAAGQRLAALPTSERFHSALAPHAPYSVSPALLREIGRATSGPLSLHLGESPEEVQFLLDGTGRWRDLLERIGAW